MQPDRASSDIAIKPLTPPAITTALSRFATWTKANRNGELRVIDPPPAIASQLMEAEQYELLPVLKGLARQPGLRQDGSLVTRSGYDGESMTYFHFDEERYDLAKDPTKEQAEQSLIEIRALLAEFCFVDACDEAAAISAMLTAAIRPSLSTAPGFHVMAPTMAAGKSYLTNLIAMFASSNIPGSITFPSNEEECRKLLISELAASPAVMLFDNLTRDLIPFKTLCAALTEEAIKDRILGTNKTLRVSTRTLFLSSGNNVRPVKDMTRRFITICLDPQTERPTERQYQSDPLKTVRQQRETYVSHALTIVRAFLASADTRPNARGLSSFDQWTQWVRKALIWLGMTDPATRAFESIEDDPDRESLGRLLHLWHSAFKCKPMKLRDLSIFSNIELTDALGEIDGGESGGNCRRLSGWLRRHERQIVDGLRFERVTGRGGNVDHWRCASVSSVSSASFEPTDTDLSFLN